MPNKVQLVIGAIVVAVISVSSTLLITAADHDLARALSMVGILLGAVTAATTAVCCVMVARFTAVEGRIDRVERATARVVNIDHSILRAVERTHSRLN